MASSIIWKEGSDKYQCASVVKKAFVCDSCGDNFTTKHSLIRHGLRFHPEEEIWKDHKKIGKSGREKLLCEFCNSVFQKKHLLKKHIIRRHIQPRNGIKCPAISSCSESCISHVALVRHLEDCHKIRIEKEEMYFSTYEEFQGWKASQRGYNIKSSKTNKYNQLFVCNRSGTHKKSDLSLRKRNKPLMKIGKTCPARIIATLWVGGITVKYFKTHVGHSDGLVHQRLSKEERAQLAAKLTAGFTLDQILDDIRDSCSGDNASKIHFLEKKDLYNIIRDFHIEKDMVKFKAKSYEARVTDFARIDDWVQQQNAYGNDNPVLLYKQQGDMHANLSEDDFMLIIMTTYQKSLVTESIRTGNLSMVLIDSSHGSAPDNFQLTTIAAVDDSGAGCPLAECISSHVDETAMSVFFNVVKTAVGVMTAHVFMSNDDSLFYDAWCQIMGPTNVKLLCTWHLEWTWRRNLKTIKRKMARSEIYNGLRVLLNSNDTEKLPQKLMHFETFLLSNPATEKFGEYFSRNYSGRPEEWALCFRGELGLSANSHLEALHKSLKDCYFNRSMEECIAMIMRHSRKLMFETIIRAMKNEPASDMSEILRTHKESTTIADEALEKIDEHIFNIPSFTKENVLYTTILATEDDICRWCPFTCPDCQVCPHKSSCNCFDSEGLGNICKHVHKCWMHFTATRFALDAEDINSSASEDGIEALSESTSDCLDSATAYNALPIDNNKARLLNLMQTATAMTEQLTSEDLECEDVSTAMYKTMQCMEEYINSLKQFTLVPITKAIPRYLEFDLERQRRTICGWR